MVDCNHAFPNFVFTKSKKLFSFASIILILNGCSYCPVLCEDQTSLQGDYKVKRDKCRELADLKSDLEDTDNTPSDKAQRNKLVILFSDCMANSGWAVPTPSAEGVKDKDAAKLTAGGLSTLKPVTTASATPVPGDTATMRRSAECAFARQARRQSTVSANRAEACDLECAQRKKVNPTGPLPAACVAKQLP